MTEAATGTPLRRRASDLIVVEGTPEGRQKFINGRYRLIETVGQGGMGRVWRGHDEMLDREVAIKEVLFPPDLDDEERAELGTLALREARATARLNHPGIVTIFDVIDDDGAPIIVMELLQGRSLADILRAEVRLPYRRVTEIGAAVLEALREAHAAGIVHRDLKPANILISDRRIVLTDFGVAQRVGERAEEFDDVMGTPAFMAPEQAENAAASTAADLWSLGAVLFNAVEGRPPFQGPDYATVLLTLLTQEAPVPANGGPLNPLITSLLVKDPQRRPTAEQTAVRLEAVLHQDDGGTPPMPPKPATPPRDATHPDVGNPAAPVAPAAENTGTAPAAPAKAGIPVPKPTVRPGALPGRPHYVRPDGPRPHGVPAPAPARSVPQRARRAGAGMVVTAIGLFLLYSCTHFSSVGAPSGVDASPSSPLGGLPGLPSDRPSALPSDSPTPSAPAAAYKATAFSPDGRLVAFGDESGEVRLYDTASRRSRGSFDAVPAGELGVDALAFSPDGQNLAVGLLGGEVDLWNVAHHKLRKLDGFDHEIGALGFSPDSRSLTAVGDSGLVGVWTVRTRKYDASQIPLPSTDCAASALSADATRAVCGTDDGAAIVWDAEKRKAIASFPAGDQIRGLALSPDGKTLAVATNPPSGKSRVRLWNVSSQRKKRDLPAAMTAPGNALVFSADGRTLAIPAYTTDSDSNGVIDLWTVGSGTRAATWNANTSGVWAMAVSRDGRLLATADEDGAVLWDARSHTALASWRR
jgi:WD40 repeat protein